LLRNIAKNLIIDAPLPIPNGHHLPKTD